MLGSAFSLFARALWAGDFAAVRARIRAELAGRGRRTLDLGCGPGLFADVFAGEDYVGVDPDIRNVAWARRARPGAFLAASPRRVDLPEGRFDQALVFGVVETLADPDVEGVFRMLRRLLVPEGRALVIAEVPRADGIGRLLPGPRPSRDPQTLGALLGAPVETFRSGRRRYAQALVRWS